MWHLTWQCRPQGSEAIWGRSVNCLGPAAGVSFPGHPSMWSSCSAWGSKYAWTASLLSMFLSSSNASKCSYFHSNFPVTSSPSLQAAFWYRLASMNRELRLTVQRNELSSVAFLGRPADLMAFGLARVWRYSIFREHQATGGDTHPGSLTFSMMSWSMRWSSFDVRWTVAGVVAVRPA